MNVICLANLHARNLIRNRVGQVFVIDWVVLTYFLWERVVQDLIECTHNVCFRDDWGEENRAQAVQLFDVILAEDRGHIAAAHQASAHLPRGLTVHSRKSF